MSPDRRVEGLRVGIFVHALDGRAVAKVAESLASQLSRLGASPWLISVWNDASPRSVDAEMIELGGYRQRTSTAIPKLRSIFGALRLDAVLAHANGPARAAALAAGSMRRHRPIIVAVEHTHFSTYDWSFPKLRALLTGQTYRLADHVVGVAPEVIADLADRFPWLTGKLSVIPPPLWRWDELDVLAAEEADEPWFGTGSRTVVSVANVGPRKDQATLIRAVARASGHIPDLRLMIVGRIDDDDYYMQVLRLVRTLRLGDRVRFLGFQENPLRFVSKATAYVSSSRTEGSPIAVTEAMALGVPIIATTAGGSSWVLDHGRCGLLSTPGDVRSLAQNMVAVLTDPELRNRLVVASKHRVQKFEPKRVAMQYLDLVVG